VLGLNTSGLTRGEALTIPVSVAWLIADSLAKHGTVKRGYLGVRTQPDDAGLLVLWLEKDGPAEKGGLLVGDILTQINAHALKDADDLFAALTSDTVGQATNVEILRGGQPQTVHVTIGERK
jgi:S1-C subfamily serine protease